MKERNEQTATSTDLADHNPKQKTVPDAGVSSLSKSGVEDHPKRMVHAYTLHARSDVETKVSSKPAPASHTANPSAAMNATPQVRYKRSIASSGFGQIGGTFDMAGQLG